MKLVSLFLFLATLACVVGRGHNHPFVSEETRTVADQAFAEVRDWVLALMPHGFTQKGVNTVLEELNIFVPDNDGPKLNPLLHGDHKWIQITRFGHILHRYAPSVNGHTPVTRAHRIEAAARFLDTVIDLNKQNPAVLLFMSAAVEKFGPASGWPALLTNDLRTQRDRCVQSRDLGFVVRQSMHLCLMYDHLTRKLMKHPQSLLRGLDELYDKVIADASLGGIATFWQVKYPSVRKPIKELLKIHHNHVAQALPAGFGPHAMEEEEEEEEEGFISDMKVRLLMRATKSIISKDPSEALRVNIWEACMAEMIIFNRRLDLVPHRTLPPNTKAGFTLMYDRYYNRQPGEELTPAIQQHEQAMFAQYKILFTDSQMWMFLYSAWNLAFTMNTSNVGAIWAKLVPPAVLEDLTGETYVLRRAVALWLCLVRVAIRHSTDKEKGACPYDYAFNNNQDAQHLFGQQNWKLAKRYMHMWHNPTTQCPTSVEKFHDEVVWHRHKTSKILRFAVRGWSSPAAIIRRGFESLIKGVGRMSKNMHDIWM